MILHWWINDTTLMNKWYYRVKAPDYMHCCQSRSDWRELWVKINTQTVKWMHSARAAFIVFIRQYLNILSIYLLFVYLYFCLFVFLSVFLSVYLLFAFMSVSLSFCLWLSVYLLFVSLSFCLICFSDCQSIWCLSICFSVHLSVMILLIFIS